MKNKKIIYGLVLMLLFSLLISGCSSKSQAPYDNPVSENNFTVQEDGAYDESEYDKGMDSEEGDEKS